MDELTAKRESLQSAMTFLAALSSGLEQFIGRAANGMAFVAGKSLGKRLSEGAERSGDLLEALENLKKVLASQSVVWEFEAFNRKGQPSSGNGLQQLVFRDCMIRQSLFRYGHSQKGSLCYMMYGFFSGALEQIMGKKTKLDILHTGENACLKELSLS